jgi:hypothetical protein
MSNNRIVAVKRIVARLPDLIPGGHFRGWRGIVNHVEELRQAIRKLHGAEAIHIRTVPVRETHRGNTREGLVEVF